MRRLTAILSIAAVALTAASLAAQGKASFAGEWKMERTAGGQGEPGLDLAITQDAASVTIDYRRGGPAPGPVKLTYRLDGSASRNMMAAQRGAAPTEQVSKAVWAGNTIVVTTPTGAGEEKRTFSMDGDDLVVEISTPARLGSPKVTRVIYKRYERGHGG
jgi:hypothetical protein